VPPWRVAGQLYFYGVQGSILGPLLLLFSVLPPTINYHAKPLHFVVDTEIIYHPDSYYIQNSMNIFASLNKWFKANNSH
jgi:hypothetical protein